MTSIPFIPKRVKLLSFDEFGVPGVILEVDVSKMEQHGREVDIAQHPVGHGIPISDNARPKPETFSCVAIWTDRPGSIADTVKKVAKFQFVQDIYDQLIGVQEKGHTFTVITTLRTYTNMFLQRVSTPRSSEISNHIECTLNFTQKRTASALTIAIPTRPVQAAKAAKGPQPTTSAPVQKATTVFRGLTNSIGITPR